MNAFKMEAVSLRALEQQKLLREVVKNDRTAYVDSAASEAKHVALIGATRKLYAFVNLLFGYKPKAPNVLITQTGELTSMN